MSEYRRAINHPTHGLLLFEVDKMGGGTVGVAYTGDWFVRIVKDGVLIYECVIGTGKPAKHWDLMSIALEFAVNEA